MPPPRCRGFTWASGAAWRSVYGLGSLARRWRETAALLIEHQPLPYADLRIVALLRAPSRYGYCSLLALLGGRASNGAGGGGGRVLQRAHDRIAASHCAGSARLLSIHRHRCLLDVGGGDGASPRRQRGRHLRLMLSSARGRAARARLADAGLLSELRYMEAIS